MIIKKINYNKQIYFSKNYKESFNDFEENNEENQEENIKQTQNPSTPNIDSSSCLYIGSNPYCQNNYSNKESSHKSKIEISKKEEEKFQDKNNDKNIDWKIVDSKAKTDYTSVNNKDK